MRPTSSLTLSRVYEELPHFGSSSHIFAEPGTTACGHLAITRMPRLRFSNCLSYGYHGKDELELPCLLSSQATCAQSNPYDKPSLETFRLRWRHWESLPSEGHHD